MINDRRLVAKSVSHPTVDDLGLVPNTLCNLRVCFVTRSAVIHSTAGLSSLPADADCESPSLPCPAGRRLQSCGAVAQQTLTSFLCASRHSRCCCCNTTTIATLSIAIIPLSFPPNGMSSLLSLLLLLSLDFRLFV
jgi:hypothetical protein